MLRLIGNLLWFVLGGFFMGLAWTVVGVLAFASIIGIPWGRACFMIAGFTFWPFGREAVNREVAGERPDIGTGPLGVIGNIIWLLVAGWWLALGHLFSALIDFVTVIGIPFGVQHIKLAGASLFPIGLKIVVRK
jgi:uncharacterized membrane protein YccF (DUF307 family)